MEFFSVLIFVLTIFSIANSQFYDENYDQVQIKRTELPGTERFPDDIRVHLQHNDKNVRLNLRRDDELTSMLDEGVFAASRILPDGLYTEETSDHFSAYVVDGDTIIVQREHDTAEPKFYGRYMSGGNGYIIGSVEGRHDMHRVRREAETENPNYYVDIDIDEHGRAKRAISINGTNAYVIEAFLYADLSIWNFFFTDVFGDANTTSQTKSYIKEYLTAATLEVDKIMAYIDTYGSLTNATIRVYFMEYQIITKQAAQPWFNVTKDTTIDTSHVEAMQTYYKKLVRKFSFPKPDLIIVLTNYPMATTGSNDGTVITLDSLCQNGTTSYPVVFAGKGGFPNTVLRGIGLTFNLSTDDTSECPSSDRYIMASDASPGSTPSEQGNRWKFSSCSVTELSDVFSSKSLSCLRTEDSLTDMTSFLAKSTMGELYDRDQQCVLQLGSSSSFCTDGSGLDCYSTLEGCSEGGACATGYFADGTLCDKYDGIGDTCEFGFCSSNASLTTTTTTSTTTSTTPTPTTVTETTVTGTTSTTRDPKETTSPMGTPTTPVVPECLVETGYVEFDLPGCGCCGGCGCDDTCDSCPDGIGRPKYSGGPENCTRDEDCCGSKVRVTTLFAPEGCEIPYEPGPRTLIMEKKGWEQSDLDVTAEVWQKEDLEWRVKLLPKN